MVSKIEKVRQTLGVCQMKQTEDCARCPYREQEWNGAWEDEDGFSCYDEMAADALERKAAGPGSREGTELVRQLRNLADVGIVNARTDTAILRRAADWIEAADERIAIMAESLGGGLPVIRPGGDVDLLAALDEGKRLSGLIEEE